MAACSESLYLTQKAPLAATEQEECWYALRTRGRHERTVEHRLRERGVATFLPMVTEIHRWSDRNKKIQFPLFSGYLFVRLTPSRVNSLRVLRTDGVFSFVGNHGEGTPIPDAQIEAVRAVLDGQLPWSSYPFLTVGQRVRIRSGALEGVEGILVSRSGETAFVISVDAIQRSLAVRVEGYDIQAA
jgi:transcription antitermination factor NusG